jgi:MSHA pilin protein MshC
LLRSLDRPSGFTLAELVVVIAVIAVLSVVVLPRYASNDTFETRGDAGLVSATLKYAQKTAIAQRRIVYVVYNATVPPSLSLCFTLDCSQTVINPENGNPYSFVFSRNVQVNAGTVGFDSLGRPVPNQTATLVITNAKNNQQSVTVNVEQDTGYIH